MTGTVEAQKHAVEEYVDPHRIKDSTYLSHITQTSLLEVLLHTLSHEEEQEVTAECHGDAALEDGDDEMENESAAAADDDDYLLTPAERMEVVQRNQRSAAENTKDAYDRICKQWLEYCKGHGIRPIPHAEVMAKFVKWRMEHGINGCKPVTSWANFRLTVAALEKMKKRVEATSGLVLQNPAGTLWKHPMVREMKESIKRSKSANMERNQVDPQKGSVARILCRPHIKTLSQAMRLGQGPLQKSTAVTRAKYRSQMLFMQQGITRSDDVRTMRLCEMFTMSIPSTAVGPTRARALCMISYNGKENQMGRAEYAFSYQHVDPEVCSHLAMAMYLQRMFSSGEWVVPDFLSTAWFAMKVWPAHQSRTAEMSLQSQSEFFRKAFVAACIVGISSKLLHSFRAAAAHDAHMHGATHEQVEDSGRWKSREAGALSMSYLGSMCGKVGVILAGGGSGDPNCSYFVPWAHHVPDAPWVRAVFPWVEAELQKVREFNAGKPASQHLVAAEAFLTAMLDLRVVLWQGSAVMDDPLFQQGVFNVPEAKAWRQAAQLAYEANKDRAEFMMQSPESRLEQVLSQLCAHVSEGLTAILSSDMSSLTTVRSHLQEQRAQGQVRENILALDLSPAPAPQLLAAPATPAPATPAPATQLHAAMTSLMQLHRMLSPSQHTGQLAAVAAAPSTTPTPASTASLKRSRQQRPPVSDTYTPNSKRRVQAARDVPAADRSDTYAFSSDITTVADVWKEFSEHSHTNPPLPPIKWLMGKYGVDNWHYKTARPGDTSASAEAASKADASLRKRYNKARMPIIREIIYRVVEMQEVAEDVIKSLDSQLASLIALDTRGNKHQRNVATLADWLAEHGQCMLGARTKEERKAALQQAMKRLEAYIAINVGNVCSPQWQRWQCFMPSAS